MEIMLRELTLDDSKYVMEWRNSTQVLRYCIDQSIITKESFADFFREKIETKQYRQYMVEKIDDEMGGIYSYDVATIFIRNCDEENKKCELGILPSPDYEWNDDVKAKAISMMVERVFCEMQYHKIYATVFADSTGEIKTLKKAGFVHEAYLEDEIREEDGSYRDLVRMKILG